LSKSTRGFYPRINNYLFPEDKYNHEEEEYINQIKEKKKPSVNQFEFINKINSEKRKLNPNEFLIQNYNINHSNNISKKKIKSDNIELNDSFRHKSSKQQKKSDINNIKNNLKFFSIKHFLFEFIILLLKETFIFFIVEKKFVKLFFNPNFDFLLLLITKFS
jgi:hypothetical protein